MGGSLMNQIILKHILLSCLFGCLGLGVLSAHATTPKQFDNTPPTKISPKTS